jgi:hypothetical protein
VGSEPAVVTNKTGSTGPALLLLLLLLELLLALGPVLFPCSCTSCRMLMGSGCRPGSWRVWHTSFDATAVKLEHEQVTVL